MEKNSYQTYEFLATTNPNSDTNQFFVLQDDGTILTVNREIQYITQVEDNKETGNLNQTEGCAAVFDVSSQQYYVDVEGSATEMVSINNQYAVTNGENNVYTSSYLIQPESSSATHQVETEVIDPQKLDAQQLQQHNVEAFNGAKQGNDLAEITLSDEQYQILEHKGWLLLESNNRIFVLNTLGLHDITTNDKLIQQLKNELQDNTDTKHTNNGQLKIESVKSILQNESSVETAQEHDGDIVEYFIAKKLPIQHAEPVENVQFAISENIDEEMSEQAKPSETKSFVEVPMTISKLLNNGNHANGGSQKCDSIKIKTKYSFADIPDKIFLGKSTNGKKLFAKVTKLNKSVNNKMKKSESQNLIYGKKIEKKPHYGTSLDGTQFTNLVQDSFRNTSKVSPKAILTADAVISQLLRLPDIKGSIAAGTNLVVTKIITIETENGKEIGQPTMVTGTVKLQDEEETFIHMPLLLHQLLDDAEDKSKAGTTGMGSVPQSPEERTAKGVVDLFHVHISETRFTDKAPQTSINLSKRKLALDVLNDAKKRHPNPVYACGSCGAVFKSENLLKDHQNNDCLEVEDELTIDTDDLNNCNATLYSIVEIGNEKWYTCTLCQTKFTRLFNCQKHIKAHKTGVEKKLKAYKCKMCPNTYFHSSSLSKHIVKMHIQMQFN